MDEWVNKCGTCISWNFYLALKKKEIGPALVVWIAKILCTVGWDLKGGLGLTPSPT